ncbi:MAG: pantoate--beta-alanine ligase [Bdellovibrionales bacterium]|nr:pantoate--beta-alanine ligase [Bdellovibrionales bacterium]
MKTFTTLTDFITWRKATTTSVAFVPTMGALHEGHLTLVREAKKKCDLVVVSIFVNPTQFNDPNDLKKYPRTIETDSAKLKESGADVLLLPNYENMYPDGFKYKLTESDLSTRFCGAHRPGHFDGVLTIVLKLFNLVRPQVALFGLKDYQQYQLIKKMAAALFLDIDVIGIETIREKDGLAMSSRNALLSSAEREKASLLNKIIAKKISAEKATDELQTAGFDVDYVEDFEDRRLAAAKLGNVRLIDNVEVPHE